MKKRLKTITGLLLVLCFLFPITALADTGGSGNIDGGGGDMNPSGSSNNVWSPGNDGVRVTVVRASDHAVAAAPIDFTNITPPTSLNHFGKVCKIQYNNGTSLAPRKGGYVCIKPAITLPRIVSTNGTSNISAIKKYFCSEYVVKRIAEVTGISYDILIGGRYKILLEPIAYYKFQGAMIATTATEAALYNQQTNGILRYWMKSLSHKNLPLAMFLETADLGYPVWGGSRTDIVSDADILSTLGLGIIRFSEQTEPPAVSAYDYEYRTNTEVITSVTVSGGQSNPDSPAKVTFDIGGRRYTVSNVYFPRGDSQLAWVKWRTPDTAQSMVIPVTVSGPGRAAKTVIHVKVVDLDQNSPPNPVANDRNDNFTHAAVPDRPNKTDASWTVWRPWWKERWVWRSTGDGDGYWVDRGQWEFDLNRYSASLTASTHIQGDDNSPTTSGHVMKSGYGINQMVTVSVSSSQSSAVTQPQNAISYFPEFHYKNYWRLLERMGTGRFEFQKNPYSTYKSRTHFTPLWMPDGAYTVNTWVIDAWTPVGMLSANRTDSLTIRGNLWQDWHMAPVRRE